uniref:Uncharacterized protein n=1 Tax=Anguilla anguilla TaxID=7936 RepID=A0A0E9W1S9_ANGAN
MSDFYNSTFCFPDFGVFDFCWGFLFGFTGFLCSFC